MFAYVFWHRPRPGVEGERYEGALTAFVGALGEDRPPGLLGASTFAVDPLPWLTPGGPGYEDWYLLESAAALDVLERAAVSGACKEPHAAVAALAVDGAGGLYRPLAAGPAGIEGASHACWLDRHDTPRAELLGSLERRAAIAGGSLWARRLTLGPAPEFCLLTDGAEAREAPGTFPVPSIVQVRRLVAHI